MIHKLLSSYHQPSSACSAAFEMSGWILSTILQTHPPRTVKQYERGFPQSPALCIYLDHSGSITLPPPHPGILLSTPFSAASNTHSPQTQSLFYLHYMARQKLEDEPPLYTRDSSLRRGVVPGDLSSMLVSRRWGSGLKIGTGL